MLAAQKQKMPTKRKGNDKETKAIKNTTQIKIWN
jgi:hypothetical protein